MDSDKLKFQYEGLKWLLEMQMVNHPQLINNLKMNIFSVSKGIKEVELLIYREQKSMLVLLELSWFSKKFKKREIFTDVQDVLSQMLPTFKFRVIDDPKIMAMSVEKVKKILGGSNEVRNVSNPDVSKSESGKSSSEPGKQFQAPTENDIKANTEEQPKSSVEVQPEAIKSDT